MNILDRLEIPASLIPGYLLAIVAASGTLYIALTFGPPSDGGRQLQVLLFLVGGTSGWFGGILFSPVSQPQSRQFETLGRVLSTFISGAILGKLLVYFDDPNRVREALTLTFGVRLAITMVAFLISALCSYMPRAAAKGRGIATEPHPH